MRSAIAAAKIAITPTPAVHFGAGAVGRLPGIVRGWPLRGRYLLRPGEAHGGSCGRMGRVSSDDLVREAGGELYSGDPEEFIERRGVLAARARVAGDAVAAKRIAGLRKPTRSAWVLNQLVRSEPGVPGQLAELGEELRAAQRSLDGAAIRELSVRRRYCSAPWPARRSPRAACSRHDRAARRGHRHAGRRHGRSGDRRAAAGGNAGPGRPPGWLRPAAPGAGGGAVPRAGPGGAATRGPRPGPAAARGGAAAACRPGRPAANRGAETGGCPGRGHPAAATPAAARRGSTWQPRGEGRKAAPSGRHCRGRAHGGRG